MTSKQTTKSHTTLGSDGSEREQLMVLTAKGYIITWTMKLTTTALNAVRVNVLRYIGQLTWKNKIVERKLINIHMNYALHWHCKCI